MSINESAFVSFLQRAWNQELAFADLLNLATALEAAQQRPLAAILYQTWLARNQTPYNHYAFFNLGVELFALADFEGARGAYTHAICLHPGFLQPRFNLGLTFEQLGRNDAAEAEWRWIEQHAIHDDQEQRPFLLLALNNLGRILENARRYGEAQTCLDRSLAIDPRQPDVLHHWVFLRERQCIWPVYEDLPGVPPQMMREATSALAMLSLSDDPQAQLEAARNFVRQKVRTDIPPLTQKTAYGHRKIRIGYCSSDFCLHPVAMLTAELFEAHDHERFEIHGFCWTREDGSAIRKRIIAAMDNFVRIDTLDDETAAHKIRECEIDVLIDLQGQTLGARPNLLAYRPAPIQITYLGLPATTGLPSIDYVIADRFLIPAEMAPLYSETPIYMPDVYQVSDRKRTVSAVSPSRQSCGLPETGFVFCSFNNNFKYTPEVFAAWMNILERVPDSVLWLLADNSWAQANLRREARTRGIDEARLVFATRVAPENYLARYTIADLFLDTFPFNAGTTANDALWMGTPVLTCSGRSFASRMAGALLTAAGIPELITGNLRDYEEKAVALARSPADCLRLKRLLGEARDHGPLFDTARFARNLETEISRLVAALPGAAQTSRGERTACGT